MHRRALLARAVRTRAGLPRAVARHGMLDAVAYFLAFLLDLLEDGCLTGSHINRPFSKENLVVKKECTER